MLRLGAAHLLVQARQVPAHLVEVPLRALHRGSQLGGPRSGRVKRDATELVAAVSRETRLERPAEPVSGASAPAQRGGERLEAGPGAAVPVHAPGGAHVPLHLERPALEALGGGVQARHRALQKRARPPRGRQVHRRRLGGRGVARVRPRVRDARGFRVLGLAQPRESRARVLGVAQGGHHRLAQTPQPLVVAPELRLQQLQRVARRFRRALQLAPPRGAAARAAPHALALQARHAVEGLGVLPRGHDLRLQRLELLLRVRRQLAPLREVLHRLAVHGGQHAALRLGRGELTRLLTRQLLTPEQAAAAQRGRRRRRRAKQTARRRRRRPEQTASSRGGRGCSE